MNLSWYINRLKAMELPELGWRVSQKELEKHERKRFSERLRVDEVVFNDGLCGIRADWSRLPLNLGNKDYSLEREITLLGDFPYDEYRNRWHAGFQTEKCWPLDFSYELSYKQRDEIGDARTNWELNRGFQFALLAKDYYASREKLFIDELSELFNSWCEQNPFLWGISWTSAMEVAIRCINWMYAAAFLDAAGKYELASKFETGAANMADYVSKHYSRYSSSNNHAIVEACALGLAGFVYGREDWATVARNVLGAEVPRQNHADGVNKEQCLHYQVFFMEAICLYMVACQRNGREVPNLWTPLLEKMCDYVQDCRIAEGTWLEFGDDDEGIIINLCGPKPDCCEYVLQFMGLLLGGGRWAEYSEPCETLRWLFSSEELISVSKKSFRETPACVTYPEGGVTIMRSKDGLAVLGMDHGPLGFGAIAAHGHADALSVQLFVDGECLIGDPGTCIYHCDLPLRNELRRTGSHSTVCVGGKDQSEMLGAFMWGKRANASLSVSDVTPEGGYVVKASHDGYAPVMHTRKVSFDGDCSFVVTDTVAGAVDSEVIFIVPDGVDIDINGASAVLSTARGACATLTAPSGTWKLEGVTYSPHYGVRSEGSRLVLPFNEFATVCITCKRKVPVGR